MLKSLISLFAEKFFSSKRETVQSWLFPKSNGYTELSPTPGKDLSFIPPADGWIQLVLRNGTPEGEYSVSILTGNGDGCPRLNIKTTAWYSTYWPVHKGKQITLSVSAIDIRSTFQFHPYN